MSLRLIPLLLALIAATVPTSLSVLMRGDGFVEPGALDGDTIARNFSSVIVWGVVYLAAVFSMLVYFPAVLKAIKAEPLIVVFLVAIGGSVLYDQFPARAFIVAMPAVFVILISLTAAGNWRADPLLFARLVFQIFGLSQCISLGITIFAPHIGISDDGRWIGWHGNANAFGREAFMAFAMSLVVMKFSKRRLGRSAWVVLGVAILNLMGSESITSIFATVLFAFLFLSRRASLVALRFWMNFVPLVIIGVGVVSIVGWDSLFGLFGRDLTLTGRLTAWELGVKMIFERPFLGHGAADTRFYIFGEGISATNFHNSYLELAFRLGVVGLGIFLVIMFNCLIGGIRWMRAAGNEAWPFFLVLAFLLIGLTESVIFATRSQSLIVFWVCIFLVLFRPMNKTATSGYMEPRMLGR